MNEELEEEMMDAWEEAFIRRCQEAEDDVEAKRRKHYAVCDGSAGYDEQREIPAAYFQWAVGLVLPDDLPF